MTSTELIVPQRKYRRRIPEVHQVSLDSRIQWLWHQRFGTVQMIWMETNDVLDKTACTMFLQAIMASDLESIGQIFQRLEGGALVDTQLAERNPTNIRI